MSIDVYADYRMDLITKSAERIIPEDAEITFKVLELEKKYKEIKGNFDFLIVTLKLESNRENLRKGQGLEELFTIIDNYETD